MSVPTYMTIVDQLFTELDLLLKDYTFNVYQTLAAHLRAPLGLGIVLFIMLMGFSISLGYSEWSMKRLTKAAIKIGILYTFAMNWGYFSEYFVQGIGKSAGQIGDWIVSATPIHIPNIAGTGIDGAMQSVLIEVAKVGAWIWDKGSWHFTSPFFVALVIWGFGYVLIAIGIFEIILAKIMLALLFATAPLFFGFTLFSYTKNFFDRWLGAIMGYAFLLIFVSGTLGLALSLMQSMIGLMYVDHVLHVNILSCVGVFLVGFIGIGILLKSASLAQSIGGTVTTSSGSSMLAAGVGGFIGGTLGAMRHGKNVAGLAKQGAGGAMNVNRQVMGFGGRMGEGLMKGGNALWKSARSRLQSGDKKS